MLKNQEDLSREALEDLVFLGNFTITARGESFKGYMVDPGDSSPSKTYLHSCDFRHLAKSFLEVADFLDEG